MLYNIEYTKVFVDGGCAVSSIKAASEIVVDRMRSRERFNEVITPVAGGSAYRVKDVTAIARIL